MRISRQSHVRYMIDQKQIKNTEYFKYLGRFITINTRCTHESKPRISKAEAAFTKKKDNWT